MCMIAKYFVLLLVKTATANQIDAHTKFSIKKALHMNVLETKKKKKIYYKTLAN